jgi:hypothetical protein
MPRSVSKECNDFVDEYGDTVIQLLIAATVPSEICRMLHLCSDQIAEVKGNIGFNFHGSITYTIFQLKFLNVPFARL